ncbi:methyltransferase domain-containing protein [Candidatus Uhrbacteria bacterium]|nr:methyltransferase domain-containing protein [Candidatus Uhrbacteria bacterium]
METLIVFVIPAVILGIVVLYFAVFVFLPGRLPFIPSGKKSVDAILEAAGNLQGKLVLDLGSGDGRIVIACARAGAQATGYEINPLLVWYSQRRISRVGLGEKARIAHADFWKQSFSDFDVVIFYGVVFAMPRLEKKLRFELKPGARVIASHCAFPSWEPMTRRDMISVYER